jgi:DinB superfamily
MEKKEIAAQIKQTCSALIGVLDSFDEEGFNTVPPQGGWTGGQVAEHLLLSAGAAEVIKGRTEETTRPDDEKIAVIASIFLDFTTRLSSPDFIIPAAGFYDKAEMIDKLKIVWTKLGQAVKLLDLSVTCVDAEFPTLGHLTRLEWIVFYVFHTQRHIRQLKNIQGALSPATGPAKQYT